MFSPALGIQELSIHDGARLIEAIGNASGSDAPRPCDGRRFVARLEVDYDVPADPPPVIQFCSQALGFDGTVAPEFCVKFHTTEAWHGTYAGTVTYACVPTPLEGTLAGAFTITVAPDRSATLVGENTAQGSCSGPDVGSATTPITALGERTSTGFSFVSPFGGGTIVIPVANGRGSAQFTEPVPGQVSVDLTFEISETVSPAS